jgi:hypothetical protein
VSKEGYLRKGHFSLFILKWMQASFDLGLFYSKERRMFDFEWESLGWEKVL